VSASKADARLELLLRLMGAEELRRSEIAALNIGDLDFGRVGGRRVDVDDLDGATEIAKRGVVCVRGGPDPRRVRITLGTAAALTAYLAEYPTGKGALVRSRRDGARLDAKSIGTIVSASRVLAGVPDHRVPRGSTPHAPTSGEAVQRHLAAVTRRNFRPNTIDQRRRVLRRLRRALDVELLDAGRDDLAEWFDGLTITPESRATELSHVRSFYTWAVFEELLEVDPTSRLRRPELARRRPRPMPDVDVARALDGAPERVRPWLYLAAYAGLRACEISGLRAGDVLWDAVPPIILIEEQKGGDQASVPMGGELVEVLRDCGLPATGWLFPRRDDQDGPTPPHLVSRHANNYLHELGITHTLHTLRHWFGTQFYRASGRDLRQTQEAMRHRTPVSTAGYTFVDPGEAVNTMNLLPTFPRSA
jgi:integrase